MRTANGTPVWVSGTGPNCVILIHGVLVDHRMWRAQVDALSAHYRVCCIDMLGHGDAPDPVGERCLEDFVAQTHEVVEQVSDTSPAVLGGFSMGGLIAQAYGVQHHAALSGLIIMNAVYDRSAQESAVVRARFDQMRIGGVESAVASGENRWFTGDDRLTHAAEIDNTFHAMRAGDFASKIKAHRVFATSDGELAGKLGVISCPTLVMTGDGDTGSTPAMARRIAASIPNAQLEILDGQRHMMPVLDAARVNAILLAFLSRCMPPSG